MSLKILQKLQPSFIELDIVSRNNEFHWELRDHNMPVAQHILNLLGAHSIVICILFRADAARIRVREVAWFVLNIILHDAPIQLLEVLQVGFELRVQ